MRAAILYGKEEVRIEEVRPAAVGPGEVRIAIEAALTCGTDLKVFKRGYHARMIVPPAVFGHELAGRISELGPGVAGWKVGDRVVAANSAPCGRCLCCRHGQENLCDDLLFLNGAYAESVVVPARIVSKNLLRLKEETSFADAALVEPLACVVKGIEDCELQSNERVLVIGAGPIGLMFTVLAKRQGCWVAVASRGRVRLDKARELGADCVVAVKDDKELSAKAKALGPLDVVIEAVGKPETWEASIELVRKGGRVNLFGGCPAATRISLDTGRMHYSGLTLKASFHHTPSTIRRALDAIEEGVVRAADFVDGECPLSGLPDLLRSMATGNRKVKTLIRVHE